MKVGNLVSFNNSVVKKKTATSNATASHQCPNFTGFKLESSFTDPILKAFKQNVYKFSNQMTAVILERPKTNFNYFAASFNVGAFNETKAQNGIAHLHEHTKFLGAKGENDGFFNEICTKLGADNNAFTSYSDTTYIIGALGKRANDLESIMNPFSNMLISPSFPLIPLQKEKSIVIQEIKEFQKDPENLLKELAIKRLFGFDTEADDLVLGTEENIHNITRDDLLMHQHNYYTPDNLNIYTITGMPHEEVAALLDKKFVRTDFSPATAPRNYSKLNPINKGSIHLRPMEGIYSDLLDMSFLGPKNGNLEEVVASQLLMKILIGNDFSRFNSALSKFGRKSIGEIEAVSSDPNVPVRIGFMLDAKHSAVPKILDSMKQTLDSLDTKKITQQELDIAKKSLVTSSLMAAQEPDGFVIQMQALASSGSIKNYKNYFETIGDLTVQDVQNVAKKYISKDKANITILYPEKESVQNISFTGGLLPVTKKYKLSNNIRLSICNDPSAVLASAIAKWEVPNHSKVGVNTILATMLEKSTAKLSEHKLAYSKAVQGLENMSITPSMRGLVVNSLSLNEDLLPSIKLMKEMLFEPNLSKSNFNRAKNEVVSDLLSEEIAAGSRAFETMYGDSPEGVSTRLLAQEIENVAYDDVVEYYQRLKKNSRLSFSVLGHFSEPKALEAGVIKALNEVNLNFSKAKMPKMKFTLPKADKVVVQYDKGIESSEIMKLFHLNISDKKDVAPFYILNKILGDNAFSSRLYADLREKQELTYGADSTFLMSHGYGQEIISSKTAIEDAKGNLTDNIKKIIDGFNYHISLLMKEPPTIEEVESAQKNFLTLKNRDSGLVLEANSALLFDLIAGSKNKLDKELLDEILKVTPQDVHRVAKKYLTEPSVTSVLTTKKAAEKNADYFKSLGDLKIFEKETD